MIYDIYYRVKDSEGSWDIIFGSEDKQSTLEHFIKAWFGKDPYSFTPASNIENDSREFFLGGCLLEDVTEGSVIVQSWEKIGAEGKLGEDEGKRVIKIN